MICTTTPDIQAGTIKKYHGIVHGEAILGADVFKDMFAGIRNLVGGRAAAYEKELSKARMIAVEEMKQQAEELGANAVVGIDLDYEVIGQSGSMMMVTASGTAVTVILHE